jgi:tRNA nucleotidyltransferase (CCA-adding enzyme)
MKRLRPTPSVLQIVKRLEDAGFEAWCVGGAIRDALLGGAPLDWDVATSAHPEQVQELFGRRRTIPVGIEFGTVAVLDEAGVAHEVTTFRRDVRTDGRHAEVEFGVDLETDLSRRDFTINAIAYRPSTGELRDPFGGRADIDARIVRAVGDPDQRMREDRLRALRAMRFASRFDFAIEPATLAAVRGSVFQLRRLSPERVQQEIVKTMEQVRSPSVAFRLWLDTGTLAMLVPALATVSDATLDTLDFLPCAGAGARSVPERTANRLAALFLDLPPQVVRDALKALRFSKHQINWAMEMSEHWHLLREPMAASLMAGEPTDVQVRRWLAALGPLHGGAFLRIAIARWHALLAVRKRVPSTASVRALHRRMVRSRFRDPLSIADLAVDGDDLRNAGIASGPIYAKILHALLELVLDEPARNTPEALIAELPRLAAEAGAHAGSAVNPSTEQ